MRRCAAWVAGKARRRCQQQQQAACLVGPSEAATDYPRRLVSNEHAQMATGREGPPRPKALAALVCEERLRNAAKRSCSPGFQETFRQAVRLSRTALRPLFCELLCRRWAGLMSTRGRRTVHPMQATSVPVDVMSGDLNMKSKFTSNSYFTLQKCWCM